MALTINYLQETGFGRWDSYVEASPQATFFHRAGWKKVLERAFGHKTWYLYAESDGQIVGLLPLAEVKSALFGHTLASTPFCVYGGPIGDTAGVVAALTSEACHLAESLKVDSLEFRNLRPGDNSWPRKNLYATFIKDILATEEDNLNAIPNRQRAMIRKGIKEGLISETDDDCSRLYSVYSESVRNLGTPVFSLKYLEILQDVFRDECDILMITRGNKDIAGVLSFYFRNQVLPYYGGSTAEARQVRGVNHFMYWELMRKSLQRGYGVFDFGRSKVGSGPYSFKKNFGFEPQPLSYEYYLVKAQTVPEVSPTNPRYHALINAWRRLPLPIANTIGPILAKNLG